MKRQYTAVSQNVMSNWTSDHTTVPHTELDNGMMEYRTWAPSEYNLTTEDTLVPHSQVFLGLNLAYVAPILFGNLLVICAIIKYEHLRTPTNNFILSLAVSDLLVGFTAPYFSVVSYSTLRLDLQKYHCLMAFCFTIMTCGSSMFNLMWISVDRFLSIKYPYKHAQWMGHTTTRIIIVTMWIYIMALSFLPLVWNKCVWKCENQLTSCKFAHVFHSPYLIFVIFNVTVFLIVTAILYSMVFSTARKAQQQITKQRKISTPSARDYTKQARLTVLFAIVLGCFYLCWLPFIVVTIIRIVGKHTGTDSDQQESYSILIMAQISISLAFANSSFNVIIYAWKSKDFKAAFKKMFGCKEKPKSWLTTTVPASRKKMTISTISKVQQSEACYGSSISVSSTTTEQTVCEDSHHSRNGSSSSENSSVFSDDQQRAGTSEGSVHLHIENNGVCGSDA